MFILIHSEFDDDESVIRFRILYASKNESDAENYYNSLINDSKKDYSFLNLSMYHVSEGENDIVVGSCEY
jgi:hypothetical protein